MPPSTSFFTIQAKSVDGFWGNYQSKLASHGLNHQFNQLVTTGRLQNFELASKTILKQSDSSLKQQGLRFNDSDVYKWLEASAYIQALYPSDERKNQIDAVTNLIESAQEESGYINTYVTNTRPEWKWKSMAHMHELYCIGHLIEAAVALHSYASDSRLLKVAFKCLNAITDKFGPSKVKGTCGHPEIELALYKLARIIDQPEQSKAIAELADWMLDIRGCRPSFFEPEIFDTDLSERFYLANRLMLKDGNYDGSYALDHLPIREQREIVGHSVRAGYLYTAAAESARRRSDSELSTALETIWSNLNLKRMYITGGMGSTGENEGFSVDYDLPNHHAYAETCAGISLAMWGREMFKLTGLSDYLDTVERTIFNGILSGISFDTLSFFYNNPLESRHDHSRKPWFECACCPPNVARLIGSIHEYALFDTPSKLTIGFPVAGIFTLNDGAVLSIKTDFPVSGKATVKLKVPSTVSKKVAIRIPEWCDEVTIDLVGSDLAAEYENGFAVFEREWNGESTFEIDFHMVPKWFESNPAILDNLGRVALAYGPTIYCAESKSLENAPHYHAVDLSIEPQIASQRSIDGSLCFVIQTEKMTKDFADAIYSEVEDTDFQPSQLEFRPYRLWAQDSPTYMQVWTRSLS
jgi:DUF1680 family protein